MIQQPHLGKLLHAQRLRVALGLRETARLSELRHGHLDLVETGKVTPSVGTVFKILRAVRASEDLMHQIMQTTHNTGRNKTTVFVSFSRADLGDKIIAQVLREAGFQVKEADPHQPSGTDMVVEVGDGYQLAVKVAVHRGRPEAGANAKSSH